MNNTIKNRLEYLRGELRAERISYGEIAELQSLVDHIQPDDVELLEAAGVSEFDKTYKVAVSGWAVVEVEAKSAKEAEDKVSEDMPGIAGDLYNLETHEAVPADDGFTMHTDLN